MYVYSKHSGPCALVYCVKEALICLGSSVATLESKYVHVVVAYSVLQLKPLIGLNGTHCLISQLKLHDPASTCLLS